MKVTGQIIRILDKRTVIINRGKEDGITDQTVFRILGGPEEIIDPISHETLGAVTVVKSRVKAQRAYDKFTIATTKWTDYDRTPGRLSQTALLDSLLGATIPVKVDEGELLVDPEQVQPWKVRTESPVRVGDTVEAEVSTTPADMPKAEEAAEQTAEAVPVS